PPNTASSASHLISASRESHSVFASATVLAIPSPKKTHPTEPIPNHPFRCLKPEAVQALQNEHPEFLVSVQKWSLALWTSTTTTRILKN
ncbi:MAG: hypothetical protein MJH10_20530, partial [Epibacterium sp.]|nr:hypothetical protein [Epibacterium sp.]